MGTALRPVSQPLVVSLEHPIDALANPGLGQRFLDGMQRADVTIVPKGQATTTVDVSFSLTARAPGAPSGHYRTLSWMRGTTVPGQIQAVLRGANVNVTVYARDALRRGLAWTGTIACNIQTNDVNELASGLGAIVGRSLGRAINREPL
jgi:hypothetical protein